MTTDAHHVTAPHPEGEGMVRAMPLALGRAGMAPGEVGYVNAHGTGTPQNDRIEALALAPRLRRGPGPGQLDEVAGRPHHGRRGQRRGHRHHPGPRARPRAPDRQPDRVDPAVPFDCVPGTARPAALGAALSNSFGFGGQNVSLIFSGAATEWADGPAPSSERPAGRWSSPGWARSTRSTVGRARAVAEALALGRSGIGPLRALCRRSRARAGSRPRSTTRGWPPSSIRRGAPALAHLPPRGGGVPLRRGGRGGRVRARARHRRRLRARRLPFERGVRRGISAARARRALADDLSQYRDEHDGLGGGHRGGRAAPSITLNQPTIVGDLAVARAAADRRARRCGGGGRRRRGRDLRSRLSPPRRPRRTVADAGRGARGLPALCGGSQWPGARRGRDVPRAREPRRRARARREDRRRARGPGLGERAGAGPRGAAGSGGSRLARRPPARRARDRRASAACTAPGTATPAWTTGSARCWRAISGRADRHRCPWRRSSASTAAWARCAWPRRRWTRRAAVPRCSSTGSRAAAVGPRWSVDPAA